MLTVQQCDEFEVWRCLKPYPLLDRLIKKHPEGFTLKRKNRQPILVFPGRLEGYGCQYGDYKISGEFRETTK